MRWNSDQQYSQTAVQPFGDPTTVWAGSRSSATSGFTSKGPADRRSRGDFRSFRRPNQRLTALTTILIVQQRLQQSLGDIRRLNWQLLTASVLGQHQIKWWNSDQQCSQTAVQPFGDPTTLWAGSRSSATKGFTSKGPADGRSRGDFRSFRRPNQRLTALITVLKSSSVSDG